MLWDQYHRQRNHYFFCCFDFDRTTFEMQPDWHWANSTAYLRAMMQGFIERLYPYTGDANHIVFLQDFIDYELENGLTPENYAWAGVPYASANPGDRRYTGWSHHAAVQKMSKAATITAPEIAASCAMCMKAPRTFTSSLRP